MKEVFIVYPANSGNKVFEARTLEQAVKFVEKQVNSSGYENEKYEIVKVVR